MFEPAFDDAMDGIERVRTVAGVEAWLRRVLPLYGLKHAVYLVTRTPWANRSTPLTLLTYPSEWVRHYRQNNYLAIDPVVSATSVSVLPVDWSRLNRNSRMVRRFFDEAIDFGVGPQGLTFPIRGALGDTALLSISGAMSDEEWQKLRRHFMRDFQILAHIVHAKVVELSAPEEMQRPIALSTRERQALEWAARGKSIEDVATILGISDRTARAYLDTARHKLNATNRDHAIAKAVRIGLINPE